MIDVDKDEFQIRKLIENWVVWRDSGNWDSLRTAFHEGGIMHTTWFEGTGEQFIQGSKAAFERGLEVLHFLGGSSVEIEGNRAVAQTKMKIEQRADVEGVICDCVCSGRFYDLLEKRAGRWGIVLRQPIYEMDRLDAVDATMPLKLDPKRLASLPAGYRHLAYLQTKIGLNVRMNLPGTRGPEVEALYAKGREWLDGGA